MTAMCSGSWNSIEPTRLRSRIDPVVQPHLTSHANTQAIMASASPPVNLRSWTAPLALTALALTAVALTSGCQQYRVEHHKRPGFYQKASKQELPTEVTLADGTVIKYENPAEAGAIGQVDKTGKVFEPREESEDAQGQKKILLRALLPEHIVVITLTCLRNEEYDLLWEQILAKQTRADYAARARAELEEDSEAGVNPDGRDEFIAFMRKHRHELVATLTRMVTGMSAQDVALDDLGEGVTRCRLRPQIAEPFAFKSLVMVKEDGWLKLLVIQ
jgi:hypothetical protein